MACAATVLGGNDVRELLFRHLATTYIEECSDHGANHVAQESVGLDNEICFVVILYYPVCLFDVAECGFDISVNATERCEILTAEQQLGCVVHRCKV